MSLRQDVLSIPQGARDLTLATLRPDGYPQATTVSYANEGLNVYFGCSPASQKAQNLAHDDRVALAVTLPYEDWSQIRGLSISGRAQRLNDAAEKDIAGQLLLQKFPQGIAEYASGNAEDVAFFRIKPEFISVFDYTKGYGHTELAKASDFGN